MIVLIFHLDFLANRILDYSYDGLIRFVLESLFHHSHSNMIQILDPLKIGYADTSTVGKHIRYDRNSFLPQVGMGIRGNWTICSFDNQFCVDVLDVVLVDYLFFGAETKDIAFEEERFLVVVFFIASNVGNSAFLFLMFHNFINIKSFLIIQRTIPFNNPYNDPTCLHPEIRKMVSNITEPLQYTCFSFNTKGQIQLLVVVLSLEELPCCVKQS